MSDAEIKNTFFRSSHYAVVGASKDQTKYGNKILKWYQKRDLPVTPVHPKEAELEGVATIKSLAELKDPKTTSVSIVTPAAITKGALELAKELDVPAIWLQPGTYDDDVEKYVKENLSDRVIYDCVLVKGDGIRANL